MSFKLGDTRYDFQVSCPYDPKHQMPHKRFIYHLTEGCQAQRFKGHLFRSCPYNWYHILRKELYENHVKICAHVMAQSKLPNNLELDQGYEILSQMQQAARQQFGNQAVEGSTSGQLQQQKQAPLQNKQSSLQIQQHESNGLPQWENIWNMDEASIQEECLVLNQIAVENSLVAFADQSDSFSSDNSNSSGRRNK